MWGRCFSRFFFLDNDLSKGLKILGLMFFKVNGMSSVEEAFLWTQRFLARKNLPKNRSLFMRNETKSKCLPKFYVSSKQDKEYYRKTTPYLEQRAAMSAVRSCEGNDWTFNGSTWELPCLKILERSIITFFFFFNYKTGLELPSFYLHAFHGLPLSFHGSCLARKKKKRQRQKVFLILILTSFLLFSKNVLSQFQLILSWSAMKSKDYIL